MSASQTPWILRHGQKVGALVFWLLAVGAGLWYARSNGLGVGDLVARLEGVLRSPWGPLLYIVAYVLRSLLVLPATLLTITGGFVFGAVWGLVYTIIGANASALVAYAIGRFFGADVLGEEGGRLAGYVQRMRRNSFVTVMTMRFIFLPYDLVNYLSGFLKIDWRAFLLATAIGALPGTIAFVLLGASFEGSDITQIEPTFNPLVFGASAVIFVLSLVLARVFRRREEQTADGEAPTPSQP